MRPDRRSLLESRPTYHLRCLHENATDPDLLERLALVRDPPKGIREFRRELKCVKLTTADQQAFEIEALLNVLEPWGLDPKTEVLAEITRLREKGPKAP